MMDKVKVSRLSQSQVNFSKKIILVSTTFQYILKENFPSSNQKGRKKQLGKTISFRPELAIIDSKQFERFFYEKQLKNDKNQKTRKVEPDDDCSIDICIYTIIHISTMKFLFLEIKLETDLTVLVW